MARAHGKDFFFNEFLMNLFFQKEKTKIKEEKRMVNLEYFFLKISLFGHILKNEHILFFGARSFLLVHILVYT